MAVVRLNEEPQEPVEIVVHYAGEFATKDGRKFDSWKVEIGGKLVNLRWKRDVNTEEFKGIKKFKCTVGEFNEAKNSVYPKYYAGNIIGDIIEVR